MNYIEKKHLKYNNFLPTMWWFKNCFCPFQIQPQSHKASKVRSFQFFIRRMAKISHILFSYIKYLLLFLFEHLYMYIDVKEKKWYANARMYDLECTFMYTLFPDKISTYTYSTHNYYKHTFLCHMYDAAELWFNLIFYELKA